MLKELIEHEVVKAAGPDLRLPKYIDTDWSQGARKI
jgi:hypothetical protein